MKNFRPGIVAAGLLVVLSPLTGFAQGASATAAIAVTPTEGSVQTPAVIAGTGFAPGAAVNLTWQTMQGSRVGDSGFHELALPLTSVTADATGSFRYAFKVPYDLGGPPHAIVAHAANTVNATTKFTITRTAAITPTSGPLGTPITLHMTGGGWTQYDNIVAVSYDNAFIGFMCSFNSQGNMTLWLPATGRVGLHAIDVWPALYWGPSDGPTPWKIAHLSDGDQPTTIPTYHLEFQLTAGTVAPQDLLPTEGAITNARSPLSSDALVASAKASTAPTLALNSGLLPPGRDLLIAGGGFKAGDTVKLTWSTVTAKAKSVKDKNLGWNITPVKKDLGTVTVDSAGTFVLAMKVPFDFGGDHDIQALVNGKTAAQTSLRIQPHFEFGGPGSVKAGEKVTIRGYGLGYEKYTAVWTVLYDNKLSGWVSAYETNGNATFEMTAVGAPGKHFIDIHEGSNGWPYLNLWESPWPWEPPAHYSFDIQGQPSVAINASSSIGGAKAETPSLSLPLLVGGIAMVALALQSVRVARERRGGRN